MPSVAQIVIKDSHPAVQAAVQCGSIHGRIYDPVRAEAPGGVKADEVLLGIKFACLSITDDKPDTLVNVGKANPWQIDGMKLITPTPYAKLSTILYNDFDKMTVDVELSERGVTKAGHVLDTQGFIAHNDTRIAIAFRCTTSVIDWLTNLTTTTSAWEPDKDLEKGHSGFFSSCTGYGMCCYRREEPKPRVHTGFYNNFLACIPKIRQYLHPLLADDQPPRTLYVAGHSLGAGIATMAACYFLTEYDWNRSPHRLRIVTAGSPRSVCTSMQVLLDAKLQEFGDEAIFSRVVRNKDVVSTVPPEALGFRHLKKQFVFLTREDVNLNNGQSVVLVNPNLKATVPKRTLKSLLKEHPDLLSYQVPQSQQQNQPQGADLISSLSFSDNDDDDDDDNENADKNIKAAPSHDDASKYKLIPRPIRDHMPQFYLQPLMALTGDTTLAVGGGPGEGSDGNEGIEIEPKSSNGSMDLDQDKWNSLLQSLKDETTAKK